MANFDQLKQSVAALIRTNGAEEITGQIMQDVLLTIINSISGGYMFGGVAQHNGNVGNPDYNVFYLAGSGAYTGYGGAITIEAGCYGVFRYNGTWTQEVVDIGVRLSGSIAEGETRGVTGDVINTALQTLFENVMNILDTLTFTYNTPSAQQATKAMIDVIMTPTGGSSHVFATLTLASATVAAAGLMSAEDKKKVDRMLTDFRSLSFSDTTAAGDQATKIVQTLSATLGENPEAITTFTLLAATASAAGLMSAADKSYLDSLPAVLTGINGAISDNLARVLAMLGYYECSTAAATAAKEVSASGYSLTNGGCIRIKMTNANTAANVTLNINSTGAYPLYYNGVQASASNTWEAGDVLEVYYDGANFQCASGGGGGEFASGEKVSDVSIEDKVKSDSNALPTSAAVSEAIPAIAKIGDNDHLLDLVDTNGNVIFYVDSSFVLHALGNSSDESDDDEIPSKGLVKALIEAAIGETGDSDVIVKEGDNDHILDVCDENGYLLFYVDSDFTFHALTTSLAFHLPETINSFVGDTLQMFFYPMLLSTDYNNVGINMFVEGEALKCKSLKRYAEYAPDSAGTKTMKLNILDEKLGILAQRQISVNVITPASPSAMKNILLIGDSETEGYVNNSTVSPSADGMTTAMRFPYGKEMKRILTSNDAATDTAPAGLGLTNIQFVGHHATSGVRHEGYGGRSASWFMGTSSPFYINGAIDFNAYLAQDSMYDDTTHKGADFIYILLGANAGATTSVLGGQLIINATPYKTAMIDLLNAIKTQIINGVGTYANPNLKVILLSYCISNPTGGAYHVLGQGEYGNGMRVPLTYYQYHMVNNELAAMDDYSSFVVSEYVSFEIDSEHAYAYINKQVNRYSSETEKTFIENVHPNEIGYKMYGQAVARDFLSRI